MKERRAIHFNEREKDASAGEKVEIKRYLILTS